MDSRSFRLLLAGLLLCASPSLSQSSPASANRPQLTELLTAGFEQYGGDARQFVARTKGYSVIVSPQAVRLLFPPSGVLPPESVRLSFVGSGGAAQAKAEDAFPGVMNYYTGNDPKQWRTDVHRFRRLRYRELYHGIDLVFHANQQPGTLQELEFDFEVSPGHDPASIALKVEGAAVHEVDGSFELVTPTGKATLLRSPRFYQMRQGKRELVRGSFVFRRDGTIGFAVPNYDRTLPLIIDPALGYSTLIQDLIELLLLPGRFPAGTENFEFDDIGGMVTDSSGNVYLTGAASAPDPSLGFQPGSPPLPVSKLFIGDAFVIKLDPTGSNVLYAAFLGGSASALTGAGGDKIALDAAGNAYIVGFTNTPTFATTAGAFNRIPACASEIVSNKNCTEPFAAKFDAAGHLVFSTFLVQGGSTDTAGPVGEPRITVDSFGAVYVAGSLLPALLTFPQDPTPPSLAGLTVTPGAFQVTRKSNKSGYVLKLHPDGAVLDYSTYLGGSTSEFAGGIAVDATGEAFVDGQTASSDFPTTAGAFQTANSGASAFLTKLKPDGSGLLFSTFLGAAGINSQANAIALDGTDNVLVAGSTSGPGFPTTPGVFKTNVSGAGSFNFVSEFDSTGSRIFSTYVGDGASVSGVKVDSSGIYVAGVTSSANYPLLNSIEPAPVNGETPAYITKLNLTGTTLVYSTLLETAVHGVSDVGIDANQNVYIAGAPLAVVTTPGAFQLLPMVGDVLDQAGFVARLLPSLGAPVPVVSPRSLQFPDILQQGVPSAPLTIRLSNFGDSDLTVTSISIAGINASDFSETNNCSAVLTGGTNCTVTIFFTPTVPSGARSASLVFAFGGGLPVQNVSLKGSAGTPAFQISPAPIDFGTFGTLENSIQTFTITNTGTGPLIISNATFTPSGIFPSADFSFGPANLGPSPTLLQPGQSTNPFQIWMHIGLDFGKLSATFTVQDNAPGSPRVLQLTGFGFHSTPDFGMSTPNAAPAVATVPAGQTASYNVIVATLPGFGLGGGSISVTCSGAPAGAKCNLSRTSLPLPDNNPETVTINVTTTAATASLQRSRPRLWWTVVAFAGFLLISPRRSRFAKRLLQVSLVGLLCFLGSCSSGSGGGGGDGGGGGGSVPTPSGTYTLTITATSGSISHTFPLTLNVK